MSDVTQRFATRVENYIKYRPGYPPEVIELLKTECGLTADSVIADLGSGTGLLSEVFLRNGNTVYGVEPNREMREAGEKLLKSYPNFRSLAAKAEATTLGDESVDFITAGQAFHWFDQNATKAEFTRIIKTAGWVVLIWNERLVTTPFLVDYEQLLKSYSIDYTQVDHRRIDSDVISNFFSPYSFRLEPCRNLQVFDYEGLKGRMVSSSYIPEPGHPNYEPMIDQLKKIFQTYQDQGKVVVEYETLTYFGQWTKSRSIKS
ncbi:MAG: class I SAM-dependent methyltransferase [Blastocatellia bacterium]|nr:class I SAM-dependent methyltransferase [Blastocatellia bacterium]